MSTRVNGFADHFSPDGDLQSRMTVEEFAGRIGMSARNVRAHQARGLLPPPLRLGRQAFYLDQHVRRAEAIKDLQRQGFNLAAIGSILGTGEVDPQAEGIASMLQRIGARNPDLLAALRRHGIIARSGDGSVRVVRPKPIKAALALRQLGVPLLAAIGMLAKVLDAIEPAAEEFLILVNSGILEEVITHHDPDPATNAMIQTQIVISLLGETTRVVLENVGSELVQGVLEVRGIAEAHAGDEQVDVG